MDEGDQRWDLPCGLSDIGNNPGIAKDPKHQIVESRGPGALIHHEVLARHFAQAHPLSFCQFMGRGYDEHEGFALRCDNIEGRVPSNWQTKKSNVERSGLHHLYLLRRENIAQRDLYFGI